MLSSWMSLTSTAAVFLVLHGDWAVTLVLSVDHVCTSCLSAMSTFLKTKNSPSDIVLLAIEFCRILFSFWVTSRKQ